MASVPSLAELLDAPLVDEAASQALLDALLEQQGRLDDALVWVAKRVCRLC
jgi:hypothetical protein